MIGMFAFSLAGHDKGQLYIIIREEGEYVYVADGRLKSIENPKRKNKKHIQIMKKDVDAEILSKLQTKQLLYNEEIKRAIKVKEKSISPESSSPYVKM